MRKEINLCWHAPENNLSDHFIHTHSYTCAWLETYLYMHACIFHWHWFRVNLNTRNVLYLNIAHTSQCQQQFPFAFPLVTVFPKIKKLSSFIEFYYCVWPDNYPSSCLENLVCLILCIYLFIYIFRLIILFS